MSARTSAGSTRALTLADGQSGWRSLPPSFAPGGLPRRLSLRWMAARLQAMSAAELGSRALRSLRCALSIAPTHVLQLVDSRHEAFNWLPVPGPPSSAARSAAMKDAERILAGCYPLLNRWIEAGEQPQWHSPFKPSSAPSPTLLEPALELRYALELNRHGHLVTLGQAWLLTGEARLLERVAHHLVDWIAQCRPGTGPGWSASIEPSMRLLQWSVAWQWMAAASGGAIDVAVRRSWLQSEIGRAHV